MTKLVQELVNRGRKPDCDGLMGVSRRYVRSLIYLAPLGTGQVASDSTAAVSAFSFLRRLSVRQCVTLA